MKKKAKSRTAGVRLYDYLVSCHDSGRTLTAALVDAFVFGRDERVRVAYEPLNAAVDADIAEARKKLAAAATVAPLDFKTPKKGYDAGAKRMLKRSRLWKKKS